MDDYFTDAHTGAYRFVFSDNHLAYSHCQQRVEQALSRGDEKIIVDNTFTLGWEMEPYFKLAAQYGYTVFVATVEKYHQHPNVHGVSDEQLLKMAAKYKVKLI